MVLFLSSLLVLTSGILMVSDALLPVPAQARVGLAVHTIQKKQISSARRRG